MNMTPNVAEAIRALTEKPMLATTAERFLILDEIKSAHKELSHPLRFSWMLSHLLSRVSVPIAPYDLIAGRTVDRLLTEEEAVRFHDFVHHEDFPDGKSFLSSGHMTYSWEAVIELGSLPGWMRKGMRRSTLLQSFLPSASSPPSKTPWSLSDMCVGWIRRPPHFGKR